MLILQGVSTPGGII